jgi:ABC-type multidrug transport system fused ATPase/permease subunit
MGMSVVGIFAIIGSIIIAFVFGWKLSLVGVLTVMPVCLVMGYFRVHLEAAFERLNALVFAESSQVRTLHSVDCTPLTVRSSDPKPLVPLELLQRSRWKIPSATVLTIC